MNKTSINEYVFVFYQAFETKGLKKAKRNPIDKESKLVITAKRRKRFSGR